MDIIIIGILLGGTYALIAVGLYLQYGIARIINLANGEILVAGAFVTFWLYTTHDANPFWALLIVIPAAFVVNWLIYQYLLVPLVRRAKSQGQLEVDSILATFGISFIFIGILLATVGGEYLSYSFLDRSFVILDENYGLNRIAAFLGAVLLCAALYIWLNRTRAGLRIRAVAVNPTAASLVSIDVRRASALAFALGGAVTAAGGMLLSTFITFDASFGVIFTLKALVIIVLGGLSDIRGVIMAAFILGLTETAVATLIDPGLTLAAAYILFLIILVVRPQGIFGRRSA